MRGGPTLLQINTIPMPHCSASQIRQPGQRGRRARASRTDDSELFFNEKDLGSSETERWVPFGIAQNPQQVIVYSMAAQWTEDQVNSGRDWSTRRFVCVLANSWEYSCSQHSVFTSSIFLGLAQRTCSRSGPATTTARHFALDTASALRKGHARGAKRNARKAPDTSRSDRLLRR